jgi:hypothetical protein
MGDRLRSIPLSSMPLNFRDAVWFTRRMGIRYLWIDSLCIIQDSKDDWGVESERMGEVYAYSFVTIAATHARNSNEGFLSPRPEVVTKTLGRISCRSSDGTHLTDLGLREYPASWRQGVTQSALSDRGWALQERVMAPRIIHFGEHMVYWECHQEILSEAGLSPNESREYNEMNFNKPTLRQFWNELTQGSFSDELQRWYTCVNEFSKKKLTIGSDKLPAVAGMAKLMQGRESRFEAYYAGIWEGDFVRGLLWRAQELGGLSQPETYRAPSWSWAALDGAIRLDWQNLKYFDSRSFPLVTGIQVQYKRHCRYGEIDSAWVRLKAPMCPAVYAGSPKRGGPEIIGPFGQLLQGGNDPQQQGYDLYHFEPTSWKPVGAPICLAYFDEPLTETELRPFALMFMGKFSLFMKPENWWEEKDWNFSPWALILEPLSISGETDLMRRVGIACMLEKTAFSGWKPLEKTIV